MRLMILGTLLLALTAACSGSDPVSVAQPATPTGSAATVTSSGGAVAPATGGGTATRSTPTPVVAPTTQPRPVATSVAPAEPRAGDLQGSPFSTIDVRVSVEDERGYSFWLVDEERPQLCPESAVPGRAYWSANLGGSDFGPVFVLWVYPDVDALEADWNAEVGESPTPKFDCELPSGFVYWNENLILAFDVWLSLGEPLPLHDHWESPSDMPAALAFLELAP